MAPAVTLAQIVASLSTWIEDLDEALKAPAARKDYHLLHTANAMRLARQVLQAARLEHEQHDDQ